MTGLRKNLGTTGVPGPSHPRNIELKGFLHAFDFLLSDSIAQLQLGSKGLLSVVENAYCSESKDDGAGQPPTKTPQQKKQKLTPHLMGVGLPHPIVAFQGVFILVSTHAFTMLDTLHVRRIPSPLNKKSH